MKKLITAAAILMAGVAHAEMYAGGAIGFGAGAPDKPLNHTSISVNRAEDGATAAAFIGYRNGIVAIESGIMTMPDYHATAGTDNYPAYKGCTFGPTCPQSAHITQDIMSRAYYLRGNLYGPELAAIEPYVFVGYANTDTHNHEYGSYNGNETVDFKIDVRQQAWLWGAGAQTKIASSWKVRAEVVVVPGYVDEEHTLRRNAFIGSIGIFYSF